MTSSLPVFHVGSARITGIFETAFALPAPRLFPDWEAEAGADLATRLSSASFDRSNGLVALQTHLWIVEFDGLTIVVDTGIGNDKTRPFSPLFDRLSNPVLARLSAAGFDRQRVDYVFNTHLHVDHVGWNTFREGERWVPVFPNATYVFARREREFFDTGPGAARRMVFEDSVLPLLDAGLVHEVPDGGEQVLDGIRFLPTPGHSAGHMAISIASRGETALFSGDVMHSPVQVYRPEWCSAFCLDAVQAGESRRGLLDLAVDAGTTVFPAHFPEGSAGKVVRDGAGLSWQYLASERR
ncbi:MBL fold metallo-hydrolase [Pandoraea soli]|uniref:Quorum-quenching lactonase YtnP n=1 Tax=Pandoraea soli TaxID=2508293 RepID=A0ABY6VZ72_9BURK|nr:MBL fold metallo-hydrolase [Pandoraea soli]VVE03707.1 putative quorum-quenching lactonase YtnP [Pandoraea soli]